MGYFKVNQVIWIKLEDHYWPGIVRQVTSGLAKAQYQVSFIDNDSIESERAVFQSKNLISFEHHKVDENSEDTNLFKAYLTAKKYQDIFLTQEANLKKVETWKFKDVVKWINSALLGSSPQGNFELNALQKLANFQPLKDHAIFYARESVCNKISLLLKKGVEATLKEALQKLQIKFRNVIEEKIFHPFD